MKNNKQKHIFFALAASSILLLSGCGTNPGQGGENSSDDNSSLSEKHRFVATPTSNSLVSGGRTTYKVILPSESDDQLLYARSELTSLFKEATNIDLGVISDVGLTYKDTDT